MAHMKLEESYEQTSKGLAGVRIMVIGTSRFQNELIAYYLSEKGRADCEVLLCNDCKQVEHKALSEKYKIALWDWQTPGFQELVAARLKSEKPALEEPYWVLYNGKKDAELFKAVWLGVRGVFHEEEPIGNIIQGLCAISGGELWFSRKTINNWLVSIPKDLSNQSNDGGNALSRRETEVLRMLSLGLTNDQIAGKLFVSTHTIRTHVYNIFKKIGVMNRVQATLWTQRHPSLFQHLNVDKTAGNPRIKGERSAEL